MVHLHHKVTLLNHLEPSPYFRNICDDLLRSSVHTWQYFKRGAFNHSQSTLPVSEEAFFEDLAIDGTLEGIVEGALFPHGCHFRPQNPSHPFSLLLSHNREEEFSSRCRNFDNPCTIYCTLCLDFNFGDAENIDVQESFGSEHSLLDGLPSSTHLL